MTTYAKPAVRSAWGQAATNADLQDPGDTYTSKGWQLGVKPPRQYFNWLENYTFSAVRYFCQRGMVDYDPLETYPVGSIVRASNGALYRSVVSNNIGNDPSTTTLGQFWDVPVVADAAGDALDSSGRIASTSYVFHNFMLLNSPFSGLSGQILASQVPLGAVQQWQGSLSINFTQLVGSIANGQVPLSAVQQWQGNLAIGWGQITGTKNADLLLGYGVNASPQGNTIAARDTNGYIYSIYYNQSSPNNENPSISQVMVTNGSDNFMRKASVAAVKAALGALAASDFPASLASNGYQKLPSGMILQWGYAQGGGASPAAVPVTWPLVFPNGIFAAVCSTFRSTPGAASSNFVSGLSRSGGTCVFDALNGFVNQINGGYFFAVGY